MTIKGDFIGFTINNIHSSELGIVRVSSGSRYEEDLLPTFNDRTLKVDGANQTYYFGSDDTDKTISIDFAFDQLTEKQLRQLRNVLGQKKISDLTFDEAPYKTWRAKAKNSPSFKYICFDEEINGTTQRVYKGEGSVDFICYYPYAYSRYNTLGEYKDTNKNEWAEASRIPETGHTQSSTASTLTYNFVNAGDLPMDYKLYYYFDDNVNKENCVITLSDGSTLSWRGIQKLGNDTGFVVDSALNLIQGFTGEKGKEVISKNLYNRYKTGGCFFKIDNINKTLNSNGMIPYKFEYRYLYK